MKEHLIKKKSENRISIISHRIILGVLFLILIYEIILQYSKDKFNFFSFNQINLYLNILYYLLCFIKDLNKEDTKKAFHLFFHFCFSLSASQPFIYLFLYLININENIKTEEKEEKDITYTSIGLLISPIILNILETLIIKRYRPAYINPIFLLLFILIYFSFIHFLGKMGMDIGKLESDYLSDFKFIIPLSIFTLIGVFAGWWLYKFITKPRVTKIKLESNVDSSELSEE